MTNKKKVFISSCDEFLLNQFQNFFTNSVYHISGTSLSGMDAIGKIPLYETDVIIMDLSSGGESNTLEIIEKIKEQNNVPFVFITDDDVIDAFIEVRKIQPAGYLVKPFKKSEIIDILNRIIQKSDHQKYLASLNVDKYGQLIIDECGEEVHAFIRKNIDLGSKTTCVISTTSRFNVKILESGYYKSLVNLQLINSIKHLNKFFQVVNNILLPGGIFLLVAETKETRKKKILKKFPPVLNYIYYTFDFILKRLFPKLSFTKKIYFFLTRGKNRVLSRTEILGRLYSCGFSIISETFISPYSYYIVKKVKGPAFDENPSYGPLFRMKRVGKGGKMIRVYKLRTMHPYSEYLQDYILETHGYSEIGKLSDDFRLTTWGKFLRRYWLDELPQLINVLKGEMKLVGVRPLSQRVFNDYPEDIKKMRLKYKPGCFPPYVALLMQNMEKSIEAEKIYLLEKEKHPYTTDIKYFCKAVYNILTNKIRSS